MRVKSLGLAMLLLPAAAYGKDASGGQGTVPGGQTADGEQQGAVNQTSTAADTHGGDDIVVTARRQSERLQDVPIAISTATGEQLQARGVYKFQDLDRSTPGLTIRTGSGNQTVVKFTIRGQTQANTILTTDSSVGIYVDGVYRPRQYGLASSLFDIAQVETLKGPQGTLFGKNTTGGALNISTVQPGDTLEGFATIRYGSYNTRVLEGGMTLPFVPGLVSLRLAAQYSGRDALEHDPAGYGRGGYDTFNLKETLKLTPGERFTWLLRADQSAQDFDGARSRLTYANTLADGARGLPIFPILEGVAEVYGPAALTDPAALLDIQNRLQGYVGLKRPYGTSRPFAHYTDYAFSSNATYDLGFADLHSITGYRHFLSTKRDDLDQAPFTTAISAQRTSDNYFSQELQLSGKAINNRLNWIVGLFYDDERGRETYTTDTLVAINVANPGIQDGKVRNGSKAAFAQVNFALTDKFHVTAGVRGSDDKRSLVSFNHSGPNCDVPVDLRVTPTTCQSVKLSKNYKDYAYLFSLDYKPTNDVLLYANTSRGYRAGGQPLALTQTPGTEKFYAPETAYNYEVGAKTSFLNRRVVFNVAGFYTDYRDVQRLVITQDPATKTLATVVTNAAKARIKGIEGELTAKPATGLTLTATGSVTDAAYKKFIDFSGDRTDEPFPIPKWTYSLAGSYTVPVGSVNVTGRVDWAWQSKSDLYGLADHDASVTQQAYGTLNARITVAFPQQFTVAAFATNLLNKHYISDATGLDTSFGFNYAYLGDPRVVGVEFKKTF